MPGIQTRNGFMDPETAMEVLSANNPFYSDPETLGLNPNPPLNQMGIAPDYYSLEVLAPKYAWKTTQGVLGTAGAVHRAYFMSAIRSMMIGGRKVPGPFAPKALPGTIANLTADVGISAFYLGANAAGTGRMAAAIKESVQTKHGKGVGMSLLEYLLPIKPGKSFLSPIRAGLKSFYGWNVLMGIDESATISDYMSSMVKHIAAGYIFRAAAEFVGRGSTGVVGIAARTVGRLGSDTVTKKFLSALESTGAVGTLEKIGLINPGQKVADLTEEQLRKATKFFSGVSGTAEQKAIFNKWARTLKEDLESAKKIVSPITETTEAAAKGLAARYTKYTGVRKVEATGLFDATRKYMKARAEQLKLASPFRKKALDEFAERQAMKKAEVAVARAGSEARMFVATRAAQAVGFGMRIANVVAGASMAVMAVRAMRDYQRESLREYISTMYNTDTTYTNFPQYQMDGTERTRAIQAIQESNLNIRNALGNEAVFLH